MADENPEAAPEEAPKKNGGLLGGIKGWIIVIGITLLQAAFWIFMMVIREPGSAPDQAEQARVFLEDPAILQSQVRMDNFVATVPGPGGDLRPINFNLVLEMHYLPEEKRAGATRPTTAQIEIFRTVVVQLESKIRDHMNTFLTGQSFTNLLSDRGPELVKAEVMRFVNNELEKYDFESLKIPEEISRRRVTNVLLPSWTLT
ncbi:MAG: flagellar basal body-associated FliL family protein [Planctomycetes bacterium]|nr:flagellar basal body-associated FliL family protein [Planctomycetota bacterium]MCD7897185.1 flagellar basal body-associated FliL family protein [Planctomycetaceae bacterium]